MGITNELWQVIKYVVDKEKRPLKVLSLGYPDILVNEAFWPEGVALHPDSEKIAQYHGRANRKFPEAYAFFKAFDMDLTVLDFKELRGESQFGPFIAWNLNKGFGYLGFYEHQDAFDVILDPGTLEHIFNVPAALDSILFVGKPDGYIIHWNPMQQPNHGFYNFSPTFYRDWYEGLLKFEIEGQWVVDHSRNNQMIPPPATQRFKYQGDCSICTLVKRVDNEDSIQYESEWPIQSKYKAMLNA